MALVACPECGQQISTAATACPHCGRPQMPGVVSVGAGPISGIGASAVTPGPEQPLWQGSPSIALLYGKVVRLVFSLLILVVIGYLAIAKALPALASTSSDLGTFVSVHTDQLKLGIIGFLVLAFIPPVFALVMAAARNRTTRYRVTNQRIVIESGLFSRSLDEIDLRSVDDIEFHQSFLERLFNIGEIALVSTDKVAPRRTLHGIHDPRNTREVIRAAAYHVSQRQLFTRST